MRKHAEPILKWVCLILAVLVLCQLIVSVRRANPLHGVIVPALPTLTVNTNSSPASPENSRPINLPPTSQILKATNAVPILAATNLAVTNVVLSAPSTNGILTNSVANTNSEALAKTVKTETNSGAPLATKLSGTNSNASRILTPAGTNIASVTGTNVVAHSNSGIKTLTPALASARMPAMGRGGMSFNPGGKHADLPAAIRAQVTAIIDSEILGPVPHPLPMALLGIAGNVAFLRSPDGQSGMVKIGDSLGELKLVRIGINRVLVEQYGQQKELMIFDGYGGDSLLDQPGGTNNEIHK